MQAHRGDETTAMLCSNGFKALTFKQSKNLQAQALFEKYRFVLNAVGDPRSFPTCKQDDLTQCICMLFSSALLKSGSLSGSSSACS